jgi:DegV family protein with EDD domain
MTIRLVTDSSSDLPVEVAKQYGITVVPFYINVGSHGYLDGVDITREEFYTKLPTFSEHPTTAVASTEKFREIYDSLAQDGADEVLSIHISTSLSATVNVAQTAAAETKTTQVTVFDSRQLSLGTGFLVETAAKMAQAGATIKDILASLQDQIKRTHVSALLDTLLYLRRSGRMNFAMSSIGELLQVKPLLQMFDGNSTIVRVRTRKKGMKLLEDMLRKHHPFEKVAILHAEALDYAQELIASVSDILPPDEVWFEMLNPVLGAHLGLGVVGFACISKD